VACQPPAPTIFQRPVSSLLKADFDFDWSGRLGLSNLRARVFPSILPPCPLKAVLSWSLSEHAANHHQLFTCGSIICLLFSSSLSSMSPPKSSPRSKLSFFGSVPPLQAYLLRLDLTSGFPGSPSAVRRGTRRSSSLASPVTLVFSCALPVSAVAFELAGWWLRQVCDLIGSVQPSIRLDHLI